MNLAVVFVFITALLDSIGFGIIMPVLPDLLHEITGESLSQNAIYSGWLMFIFAFVQFFFSPIIGGLSDTLGRRPVLLVSLTVMGVNYLLMGLAESLWLLLVGRLISGLGASTMSTCNAYIADVTPPEQRAQNFGLIGAAFGMGFILGPVIGGFLGEFGSRVPFLSAGVLSLLNMVLGFFVLKESLPKEKRRAFNIKRANPLGTLIQLRAFPMVMGLILVIFLTNLGHHVLPATWSFWAIERFDWSPKEIGYSLGFVGVGMVIVQGFLIRWVIPRAGPRLAGVIGLCFNIAAFICYSLAFNVPMVYIGLLAGALGGFSMPAMQGIMSSQIGSDQQGELQGGLASMNSLTAIISPPIMTQTFGYFTADDAVLYFPGAAFALAAVLTCFALIMFLRSTKGLKHEAP